MAVGAATFACAGAAVSDPIDGFPIDQQRTIRRTELGQDWPLEPAQGTLACRNGAVAFRADGVTYAVNDAAAEQGMARVDLVVRMQAGSLPSHPLSRIHQEDRQVIFRRARSCDRSTKPELIAPCKEQLRAEHQLSVAELAQIDTEGEERLWPPIPPRHASLEALTRVGLRLCDR